MDTETQRQKNDTTNRYHRIKNNKSKTERGQDRHLDSRGEGGREGEAETETEKHTERKTESTIPNAFFKKR